MRITSAGRYLGIMAAALVCCMSTAHCDIIRENVDLGTGTSWAPGVGIGTPSLELFDPSLGDLNFVEVTIDGLLTLSLEMIPWVGPENVLLPQTVTSTLTQQLNGLLGGDFDFMLVPQVLVQHTGLIGTITSQVISSFSFRFDESSDSLGFATVDGGSSVLGGLSTFITGTPVLVSGSRADFIDTNGLGSTLYQSMWSSTYSTTVMPSQLSFTYDGIMRVLYDYTPTSTQPEPTPVPEPPTWLLLVSGLAMVLTMVPMRQRRARR